MTRIVVPAVVLCIFLVSSAAFAQPPGAPPCGQDGTPASPEPLINIRVDDAIRPMVTMLLSKSETFRRQWDVVRASRRIRVTVVSRPGIRDPGSARARTEVSHFAYGAIRATIELPIATDLTELLAHELEHVIEQLEGVDLRALARRGEEGVVEIRNGVFETARARAVGLQVYREVYGAADPALGAAFGGLRHVWRGQTAPNRKPGSRAGPAAHLHKRW